MTSVCQYFLFKNIQFLIQKDNIGVNEDDEVKIHLPLKSVLGKEKISNHEMINHFKKLCCWYESEYISHQIQYLAVPEKKKKLKQNPRLTPDKKNQSS